MPRWRDAYGQTAVEKTTAASCQHLRSVCQKSPWTLSVFINRYDAICIGAEAGQAVEFFTEAEAYQFSVMQLFSKPIASYGSIWHLSQQIWSWRAVWKTWNWLEDDCNDNIIDTNGTNEGRVLAPSCPCQCGIRICARLSGLNTCVMCSVCSMEARTGMLPSGSWCTASHELLKGFAVSQCLSENMLWFGHVFGAMSAKYIKISHFQWFASNHYTVYTMVSNCTVPEAGHEQHESNEVMFQPSESMAAESFVSQSHFVTFRRCKWIADWMAESPMSCTCTYTRIKVSERC